MKTAKKMFENVMEKAAKEKARSTRNRKLVISAGCLVLVCATALTLGLLKKPVEENPQLQAPEQTAQLPVIAANYKILLDVNPSISLEVGAEDKISHAESLNDDGEKILTDSALPGMEVGEGIGVLVGDLVEQGYISSEKNSILITVAGAEKEKADTIKAKLTEKITTTLTEKNVEGAIIMQEISAEKAAQDTTVNGISPGKAKLIEQILAQNSLHTYDELAAMTIHELNLLRVSYYVNPEGVQASGAPSVTAYITKDSAIQIAVSDAQTTYTAVEAELTCKAGAMVYRVEFENETHEYRYLINAVTGNIVSGEKKEIGKDHFHQGDTPIATVGENAALAAALQHAGMENSKLTRCKYKTDWVDGRVIYDLYFTDGWNSGTYIVDARTGDILKYKKTQEPKDRRVPVVLIGEASAKAIAIAKDGLVDGNISKYEMTLKQNGDVYVYDLMFICNGVKYTAEIAAIDGTVLGFTRVVLAENGNKPAESEGNKPAESEGNKPAEGEGNKPAEGEGNKPAEGEGNKPAEGEGNKPAEGEGDSPSAEKER